MASSSCRAVEGNEMRVCSILSNPKSFYTKLECLTKEGAKKWMCGCTACTFASTAPARSAILEALYDVHGDEILGI